VVELKLEVAVTKLFVAQDREANPSQFRQSQDKEDWAS